MEVGLVATLVGWFGALLLFGLLTAPHQAAYAFVLGALTASVGLFLRCGSASGAATTSLGGGLAVWVATTLLTGELLAASSLLVVAGVVAGVRAARRLVRPEVW